jgi:hypothetical protein
MDGPLGSNESQSMIDIELELVLAVQCLFTSMPRIPFRTFFPSIVVSLIVYKNSPSPGILNFQS